MEARKIEWSGGEGRESLIGQSANPAMRAVYAKLGYQRTFSEVRLIRRLENDPDPSQFRTPFASRPGSV